MKGWKDEGMKGFSELSSRGFITERNTLAQLGRGPGGLGHSLYEQKGKILENAEVVCQFALLKIAHFP